jgi:hypothetical protein
MRLEVELMKDATLDAVVVDDLFGIRPVAPTSRSPNADVGIPDGQQWNVVVAIIKPVPPCNVLEILVDEIAQPPQVVVLPPPVRGDGPPCFPGAVPWLRGLSGCNSTSASLRSTRHWILQ